jgi:hypothetical protein
MPKEKRPTISVTPEFREQLGDHPFENLQKMREEYIKLKQENAKLKEDDQLKNQASVTKPPMENFDSEAIKKTCPYPMLDSKLGRYMCSKAKSDDLITLPKDRILTNEVCKLCQAKSQEKAQGVPETRTVIAEVENTSESKTLEDPTKPEEENKTSPCPFATFMPKENKMFCFNPKKQGLPKDKLVPVKVCQNCAKQWQEYLDREKHVEPKESVPTPSKGEKEDEETETDFPMPTKEAPKLYDPRDHLGICKDPFQHRNINMASGKEEFYDLSCILCKKFCPDKRQPCDEIIRELKTSPTLMKQFIDSLIYDRRHKPSKGMKPLQRDEDNSSMTLQEIESEFGLNKPLPTEEEYKLEVQWDGSLKEIPKKESETKEYKGNEVFNIVYRRYQELCKPCEELRKINCFEWCEKFKEGMPILTIEDPSKKVGATNFEGFAELMNEIENQAMLEQAIEEADHQKIEVSP